MKPLIFCCPFCAKAMTLELKMLSKPDERPQSTMDRSHYDWDKVDWSKSTIEIARDLGADPTHVSAERHKRAPETLRPHKRRRL